LQIPRKTHQNSCTKFQNQFKFLQILIKNDFKHIAPLYLLINKSQIYERNHLQKLIKADLKAKNLKCQIDNQRIK